MYKFLVYKIKVVMNFFIDQPVDILQQVTITIVNNVKKLLIYVLEKHLKTEEHKNGKKCGSVKHVRF